MNQHFFRVWILSECCDLSLDVIRWIIFPYIGEKYVERFIFYDRLCLRLVSRICLYCGNVISKVIRDFYDKICETCWEYLIMEKKFPTRQNNDNRVRHVIANIEDKLEKYSGDELTIIVNMIGMLYEDNLYWDIECSSHMVHYREYNKKEYDILCKSLSTIEFMELKHIDVQYMEKILLDDKFIKIIDKL